MSADERQVHELQQALLALARRVEALESAGAAARAPAARPAATTPGAASPSETRQPAATAPLPSAAGAAPVRPAPQTRAPVAASVPASTPAPAGAPTGARAPAGEDAVDPFALLRDGMMALEAAADVKDVPRFFVRFAQRTGLRMLLLKRWSSGLEVLVSEGVDRPRTGLEVDQPGDSRIPVREDDLFAAVAADHAVYAGPVPVKHFPLDLSLLLGRGQDRQIVVLPLPLRGRWNTFVLLDGPGSAAVVLTAVELLARHALARLLLLEHEEKTRPRKSAAILEQESARRGVAVRSRWEDPAGLAPRAAQASAEAGDAVPAASPRTSRPSTPPAASAAPAAATAGAPRPAAPRPAATSAPPRATAAPEHAAPARTPGEGPLQSTAQIDTLLRDVGGTASGPAAKVAPPPAASAPALAFDPRAIARAVGELPALPRVANHILALIADPNTTAAKLEKAIVLDQALTAKILKIANSSFYGGLRDVNTVSEAIVRLGFVTIRNWTLVTAAKSVFLDGDAQQELQQVWQQSVLSAMASQLVAEQIRYPKPEAVFVGGLMQNIGQLALAKTAPDLFRQVMESSARLESPYHLVERDLLGFDHGALGAVLIREWNLSDDLEEAVRTHHQLDEAGASRQLAAMIALGEEIAACSGSAPDEGLTIWEMSAAARVLDVDEPAYASLLERARRLRIDPRLFG